MALKIDHIDARIIMELQEDASQSQRDLADKIGLSQNACWRRIKQLQEDGVLKGQTARIDRELLGRGLVVFAMIRTRNHSAEWLKKFRSHVTSISDITDFYRIGGDYDYMLKIVTRDMKSYDEVYQRLIEKLDLENVTSYFTMEAILENRAIPIR
ncbi:transcriptional regulator, AsnC family [Aureimonas altamirensis DSM 21988]|jgi:Lrp/AsnC family transcriptional regulator|uniref:Transcriptional regulator, AsnC family n=1 Tax=Aureimonas altamirensis DSM 21988 TaxID=1121026 RepID=A0ABY1INE6_9HYPH|nr:Lrp/AsnC family transcriptional regulator [Aureimonas altamirensis]SHJ57265.1 transcriptional regulator, AsnC family [Aureimonas altamirensis DSM 21988]